MPRRAMLRVRTGVLPMLTKPHFNGRHKVWKSAFDQAWELIVKNWSDDAARLSRIVLCIHVVKMKPGEMGEWKPRYPNPSDASQVSMDNRDGVGEVWLSTRSTDRDSVMTVLHELGHAATTDDEYDQRRDPDEEWGSEACADMYAAKWGGLDRLRKWDLGRDWVHHGCIPGGKMERDGKGYIMDEQFIYHPA